MGNVRSAVSPRRRCASSGPRSAGSPGGGRSPWSPAQARRFPTGETRAAKKARGATGYGFSRIRSFWRRAAGRRRRGPGCTRATGPPRRTYLTFRAASSRQGSAVRDVDVHVVRGGDAVVATATARTGAAARCCTPRPAAGPRTRPGAARSGPGTPGSCWSTAGTVGLQRAGGRPRARRRSGRAAGRAAPAGSSSASNGTLCWRTCGPFSRNSAAETDSSAIQAARTPPAQASSEGRARPTSSARPTEHAPAGSSRPAPFRR